MFRSIRGLQEGLNIQPNNYEDWSCLAIALLASQRNEEALNAFNKAVEFNPECHEVWYNRAAALIELGRYGEAIACYEKAIEFKPDDHRCWSFRGDIAGFRYVPTTYDFPLILNQSPTNLHLKHPELSRRGYPGEVASLTIGLTYCPLNTHPLGYGFLQRKLGDAHNDYAQIQQSPRPYWRKAITAYKVALSVLTADYSEERLLTLQSLIHTSLALNEIPDAHHYQTQGSYLYEALRTQAQDKRTFEAKFSTFRLTEIDLLIGENEPLLALTQAEFYKNRALTWLLDNSQETTQSPTYDRIRSHLTPENAIGLLAPIHRLHHHLHPHPRQRRTNSSRL